MVTLYDCSSSSIKTIETKLMCNVLYVSVFQVYEQDDLSEQMASLEGLMKQLNAITGSAF